MKTKAAVVYQAGEPLVIEELELDGPRAREVLIRYTHAGICHSDVHIAHGDLEARLPMVLGHEGAGVIEEVGAGVTRVQVGDHVVCSYIPTCGECRWCASGQQAICDFGATILEGCLPGGRFPLSGPKGSYGAMSMIGSFSQYATLSEASVVKVDKDLPLDKAVLVGCGVPTGWGSSVNAADVRPGDVIVVYGAGGIGVNAVQGARYAGARSVIAVDPLANKQKIALELGATHAVDTAAEAHALALELTRGVGADKAVLAMGLMDTATVSASMETIRKGGTVVLTALNSLDAPTVQLPGTMMTLFKKTLKGSIYGDCNPTADIPWLLDLYRSGQLQLDPILTRTYDLEDVNAGIEDLLSGENIRGVVTM